MRINRPFFALPEPVGGTTIGRSKITPWSSRCKLCVYRSRIAFLLGILIQGSTQGNDFFTGIVCLLIMLISKPFLYSSLVLVQPRKTRPYITERLLMGRKESNQINQKNLFFQNLSNKIETGENDIFVLQL